MGFFDKLLQIFKKSDQEKEIENIFYSKVSSYDYKETKNIDATTTNILNKINLFISKKAKEEENASKIEDEISSIYKDITVPEERIEFYSLIKELYKSFPLARRIIWQYTTSITKVDPLTGKIITFTKSLDKNISGYENIYSLIEDKFNLISNYFDIPDILRNRIVKNVCIFGNYFVEIYSYNDEVYLEEDIKNESDKEKVVLKHIKSFLEEKKILSEEEINDIFEFLSNYLVNIKLSNTQNTLLEEENSDKKISYEDIKKNSKLLFLEDTKSAPFDINKEVEKITNITYEKLRSIELLFHEPSNVLIIHDESKIYGYLVFSAQNDKTTTDLTKYLSQIFDKTRQKDIDRKKFDKDIFEKFAKFLTGKILSSIQDELEKYQDESEKAKHIYKTLYNFDKELFYIVRSILEKQKISKINVRFVPADKMVNFYINVDEWPYGESILTNLIIYSKLYLLSLISNIITKLSRAPVIRKWILETGVSLQHANLAEKLKRELKNQIITIDSIGSISSVPRILSDFKDLIVLQKNGQRFVDFEIQRAGDPTVDIADIEDLRRELIALSGVPTPYLGYIDAVELREQLVNANVQFAEIITNYQKQIEDKLKELFDKIILSIIKDLKILPSTFINVELIKPVILQLQQLELIFASIGNILQLILQLPESGKFDVIKFIDNFVPSFDIKRFLKDETSYKQTEIETALLSGEENNKNNNQNELGL